MAKELAVVLVVFVSLTTCLAQEINFINPLVDSMIQKTLDDYGGRIEPLRIRPYSWTLTHRARFLLRGGADLINIQLRGMKSLKRTGNSVLSALDAATNRLQFKFELSNMTHTCLGRARMGGYVMARNFTGTVTAIKGNIALRYSKANDELVVMSLKVNKLSGFNIDVVGEKNINEMIADQFLKGATAYLDRAFTVGIEQILLPIFNAAVRDNRIIKGVMS